MTEDQPIPTPRTNDIEFVYFNDSQHADVRAVEAFKKVRTLERELVQVKNQINDNICIHHTDTERVLTSVCCPVCMHKQRDALQSERDKLQQQNEELKTHEQEIRDCWTEERNDHNKVREERDKLRQALGGMLDNYIELKHISLIMARSDAPGWIGRGMTVDDDIHVQKARAALNPDNGGKE